MIATDTHSQPKMSGTEADLTLGIEARESLAKGVVRLTLTSPDGSNLPPWTPGAHIDLRLGPNLVRQHSLCSEPSDRWLWQIAVLKEPDGRGGSTFVHADLRVGSSVQVRGPRNHFQLQPSARYIFVGGGIGITPILPMIDEAQAQGTDWQLFYGGRSHDSMAFADHLKQRFADNVHLQPQDQNGLIDLATILGAPATGTLVYACGPALCMTPSRRRPAPGPRGPCTSNGSPPRTPSAPQRTVLSSSNSVEQERRCAWRPARASSTWSTTATAP